MAANEENRFPNYMANLVWESGDKDLMNKFFKKGTALIMLDSNINLDVTNKGTNQQQNPPENVPPAQDDAPNR